ncbi:uncharacterized protein BT62DRAFT_719020 [Guyanagaster necrorhizus]|uniref:Uncharacterized protein n=1 Tax=Guyanagaster necrorhizus TaxID=856835 RepID=A0A9P8AUV2_9AGAR|nr:uncharacterized protein BT62DRAFT_719020 [Guyanagaster necrorhizus MCA 3950]KAG7448640.1 hypothetical protein BT62DRAFT_719020 [Guyanagaster necrorhizus MCA 3950]
MLAPWIPRRRQGNTLFLVLEKLAFEPSEFLGFKTGTSLNILTFLMICYHFGPTSNSFSDYYPKRAWRGIVFGSCPHMFGFLEAFFTYLVKRWVCGRPGNCPSDDCRRALKSPLLDSGRDHRLERFPIMTP